VKILCPSIKLIWHDHFGNSEFLEKREKGVLHFVSSYFSAIISVNRKLKTWAERHLKTKNVYFVNNFPQFKNRNQETFLRGTPSKRIVHLAGFRKQKDHLSLLKSFDLVLNKHPDWTLHLIGKVYEDSYSKEIMSFIEKNKLGTSVFLYGVCSDIEHILSQVDIGVLSSRSEGLPISLLEYGLAKLPVLVTDVGECSSVVKDKRAIVKSGDSKNFSKALQLLIESKGIRDKIALNLQATIQSEYSKEFITNKLIDIYKSVQ
jgi:glycosyltransferase involved in cell wall biosynthesis